MIFWLDGGWWCSISSWGNFFEHFYNLSHRNCRIHGKVMEEWHTTTSQQTGTMEIMSMVDMEPSMSTLEFSLQVLPNYQTHLMPVSPREITKSVAISMNWVLRFTTLKCSLAWAVVIYYWTCLAIKYSYRDSGALHCYHFWMGYKNDQWKFVQWALHVPQ